MRLTSPALAIRILRLGLGAVLLVFGVSKLADPVGWLGYLPPWLAGVLPIAPQQFFVGVGVLEAVLGALLVTGYALRVVALLAALYLLSVIVAVGANEIAVRDFGLLMALLALSVLARGDRLPQPPAP